MKTTILEQKGVAWDGTVILSGSVYTFLSDVLPIAIGILTACLFILRIYAMWQEMQQNKIEKKIKEETLRQLMEE